MAIRITEWVDVDRLPLRSQFAFDFAVTPLADGSWLTIPVKVLIGSRRRPRFVAIAGVHGDEPEGMLALLDFAAQCDPARLDGTMILVPVANPPAFGAHQRRSPLDGVDLNRVFPGRLDGTPSERLAYRLIHDIADGADFAFTLHSWFATGTVVPYVEVPRKGDDHVSRRSWAAAVAAGFTCIRGGGWQPGVFGSAAAERGIPVLEAEIGGQGTATSENRALYIDHLTKLLQYVGVADGDPPPNRGAQTFDRGLVYAPTGGMLRVHAEPGQSVEAGALLATITNLHGEQIEEMRAPRAGLLAAARRYVSINPGDVVFALFPRVDSANR